MSDTYGMQTSLSQCETLGDQLRPVRKACAVHSEFVYGGSSSSIVKGGAVSEYLDVRHFSPLVVISRNNKLPFEFLFDSCGLRYHLLLEYNESLEDSIENERLRELYKALDRRDFAGEDQSIIRCLDLFWPYLSEQCAPQEPSEMKRLNPMDKFLQKPITRIRLKTLNDGTLSMLSHEASLNYPLSDPIKNPCPSAHLFKKSEIEFLGDLDAYAFKVKIHGALYCLKVGRKKSLRREISMLAELPSHPNLPRLVGVVDAGQGKVDQLVTPFIVGRSLDRAKPTSEDEKQTWKAQISDAISVLHERNLVWGDVSPENVMIEETTHNAILIDFGGGARHGWVDGALKNSKAGDLQGLSRLKKYVDELKTYPNPSL